MAEPGTVVSGVAGTGQETILGNGLSGRPGPAHKISPKRRSRIVIGLGVLAPVTGAAVPRPDQPTRETVGESAEIEPDVPLFLVPHVIMKQIRASGEDLDGVAVKRTTRHFYTVSVRTRPVNREYASERAAGKRGGECR